MIARPPNWTIVPRYMKGTRFHPSTDLCMSDRNPIKARNGANSRGSEIMTPTREAGTFSSTIITRFSVPISRTRAMPTVNWNKDSRRSRESGRSGDAASANGRKRGPRPNQNLTAL